MAETEIEAYLRQLDEIARQHPDVQSMTHAPEKPRVPVTIEGGLIGKQDLGTAPYDAAGPLSAAAQTVYDFKTLPGYFTPLAPVMGALDFGEGIATGDPLQMGMATLGTPGKVAKAVGTAATVLHPGTAEAGSGSVAGRLLDKLGFYSKALEEAKGLKQPKATVKEFYSALKGKGVKPAELKATGFEDIFKADPDRKMAKDELVKFLEENRVPLEETRRSRSELRVAEQEAIKAHDKYLDLAAEHGLVRGFDPTDPNVPQAVKDAFERSNEAERRWVEVRDRVEEPKYAQYSREGGSDYAETLLSSPNTQGSGYNLMLNGKPLFGSPTFDTREAAEHHLEWVRSKNPGREAELSLEQRPGKPRYSSSHWSEPDVVAHLRTKERLTPDGKRILHVEEIQSDWGQAGRDKGFKDPELWERVKSDQAAAKARWDEARVPLRQREDEIARAAGLPTRAELAEQTSRLPFGKASAIEADWWGKLEPLLDQDEQFVAHRSVVAEANDALYRANVRENELRNFGSGEIEPGPWVGETKDWTDLAIKKALIDAERGGYDAISWSPGQEHADRYNLSRQVGRMHYDFTDNNLRVLGPDGEPLHEGQYAPDQLPGVIGKDNARKLLEEPTFKVGNMMHGLDADGMSWGGEGMKTYYDKIVPSRMVSLARQLDPTAELGMLPVESGQITFMGQLVPDHRDTPSLSLTPKMREEIRKGLPLFVGAPVAAGSLLPGSEEPAQPQEYAGGGKVISRATSVVSDLLKRLEDMGGVVEARRLERAADEVPALDRRYRPEALLRAMDGPVTTMRGSQFEDWAYPLPEGGRFMYETDKGVEDLDGYLRHLKELEDKGGWESAPQLWMDQGPALPGIGGHEGRHRMRSIGDETGLVQVYPDSRMRSLMRDRSNSYDREAQIKALNDYLDQKARFVTPETRERGEVRPARKFPELFADGGVVRMAEGGFQDNSRPGQAGDPGNWGAWGNGSEDVSVKEAQLAGLRAGLSKSEVAYGQVPGGLGYRGGSSGTAGMTTAAAKPTGPADPKAAASWLASKGLGGSLTSFPELGADRLAQSGVFNPGEDRNKVLAGISGQAPKGNPADAALGLAGSTTPVRTNVPTLTASAFDPTPVAQQAAALTQPTALASVEEAARQISSPSMTLAKLTAPMSNFSPIAGSAGIVKSAGFAPASKPADTSSVSFNRDQSPTFMSFDRSANPDVYDRNANTVYNTLMTEARNDTASMPGVGATLANRARTDFGGFGTDVNAQANAPGQYTGLTAKNIARAQREVESGNAAAARASEIASRVAGQLVSGELDDPTGGARSYRVTGSPSPVHDRLERAGSIDIGRHTFSDFASMPTPVARPSEYGGQTNASLSSLAGPTPSAFSFSRLAQTGVAPLGSNVGLSAGDSEFDRATMQDRVYGAMGLGGIKSVEGDINSQFSAMNDPVLGMWGVPRPDAPLATEFSTDGMRASGNVEDGRYPEARSLPMSLTSEELGLGVPFASRLPYDPLSSIRAPTAPDDFSFRSVATERITPPSFEAPGGKLQDQLTNPNVPHVMTASEYAEQEAERERMRADEMAQMDPYDRAKQWLAGALGQAYAQPINPWSGLPNDPNAVQQAQQQPAEAAPQVAFSNVPLPPVRPLDLSPDVTVDTTPRAAAEAPPPRPPSEIPNLSAVASVPLPPERPADLDSLIAAASERSPLAPVNWGFGEKGSSTNPYTRAEMAELGLGDYDPVMDRVQKYAPRAAAMLIPMIGGPIGGLFGLVNAASGLLGSKSLLQYMAENPGDPTVVDMVLGRDAKWQSNRDTVARNSVMPPAIPLKSAAPVSRPAPTPTDDGSDDGQTIETVDFRKRRYIPLDDYYSYAMRPEHTFFTDG